MNNKLKSHTEFQPESLSFDSGAKEIKLFKTHGFFFCHKARNSIFGIKFTYILVH